MAKFTEYFIPKPTLIVREREFCKNLGTGTREATFLPRGT